MRRQDSPEDIDGYMPICAFQMPRLLHFLAHRTGTHKNNLHPHIIGYITYLHLLPLVSSSRCYVDPKAPPT